ncbi:MAG: hypothetical protein LBE06_07250 [Azoarcus sp.]|jgi:hypothetical protein|nr:hypothetical protein [Azoarcus sp.]
MSMTRKTPENSGTGWRTCARVLLIAAALGLALAALRFGVIEKGLLPRDCGPGGSDAALLPCGLSWILIQSFQMQRLGWLALACGALGFALNSRTLAWTGWLTGVAGLVLYCPDYAAPGALLGLLTLLCGDSSPSRVSTPGDHGG